MKCPDCDKPLPRRTDRLWMVTWAEGRPPWYYENVPSYFTTRKAAKAYRDAEEADPDYDGPPLIFKECDDGVTYDDIAWHTGCVA